MFLLITDVFEDIELEPEYVEKLKKTSTPVLLLINKIDATTQAKVALKAEEWKVKLPNAKILAISAIEKFNLDQVMNKIIELLPEGEAFYEKDQLTDKSERFFVSEIIREKILMQYNKEIPYSVEVNVNSFKDEPTILKIQADIIVERDSQKGIIIGSKGEGIKRIGSEARRDIEKSLGKQVFLELFVKVEKEWRKNENKLRRFGYSS